MLWKIRLEPEGVTFSAAGSQSILAATQAYGLNIIPSVCGGRGICGKCKIRVTRGDVSPPDMDERGKLSPCNLRRGIRLACRAFPLSDVNISLTSPPRLLTRPKDAEKHRVASRKASLAASKAVLGIAIDLGTTTITARLVDIQQESLLAQEWMINPQRRYGEDVVTRLTFAVNSGASILRNTALQALDDLIEKLSPGLRISRICIAGNTVMQHILMGWPVRQLGLAPYRPYSKQSVTMSGNRLGLKSAPGAMVYVMPSVGGFVGGDHVASVMASRLNLTKGNNLLIDIGTNTEIALSIDGSICSASCASGPAFEGGALTHGMPAVDGAIEKITINRSVIKLSVIGDSKPLGICGSGIIEAVYQMLLHGVIDNRGRLLKHPRIRRGHQGMELILADRTVSGNGSDITITQTDIGKVQLAKAAIRTGIDILMAANKLPVKELDRVIIAGGFGAHINLRSAIGIGMLPDIPRRLVTQVGNAAIEGSMMALLMRGNRSAVQRLANGIRHIDLATFPDFKGYFSRALTFKLGEATTFEPIKRSS